MHRHHGSLGLLLATRPFFVARFRESHARGPSLGGQKGGIIIKRFYMLVMCLYIMYNISFF